jgi:peptide/nickel transport system substrate-binding protein
MRIRALFIALMLIAGGAPASAENVLRVATSNEALSFDPHVGPHLFTANRVLLVYEGLTHLSRDLRLMPSLATTWRVAGLTAWEFDIRDGVRFHDGTPLTPDDVVFSLERARGATSGVRSFLPEIVAVEEVGGRRVRITTADTVPDLPVLLYRVPILSRAWAERNAAVAVDDPASSQATFARDHANGTGPFILKESRRNVRTVVVRNGDWWGRDTWPHNVDRVEYTHMTDDAALAQALIDGRIDFLPDVPPNQLERLRQTPGIKVLSAPTVRSKSLGLNWRPEELETSSAPRPNPFRDRRVREAISRAFDMEAFCNGFMHGLCVPAGMLAAPGVNGYSEELDRRLPFDPERAKTLLAEAGLSGGFDFTLDCDPEDRGQCAELAAMLARVGVTARLGDLDHDAWMTRMQAGQLEAWIWSYAPSTLDSLLTFQQVYQTGGPVNGAGFSDPAVDAAIAEIEKATVTYARDALIEELWRRLVDEIVYVPLYTQVAVWAMPSRNCRPAWRPTPSTSARRRSAACSRPAG